MRNLDPNYGDNTVCDCCGRVFDARNEPHEVIGDNWVCGDCVANYDEEELHERLLIR
jgi:rubredoxin